MKNKMIKILAISLLVIVLLSLFVFNVFAYSWSHYAYYEIVSNGGYATLRVNNAYLVYDNVEYSDPDNSFDIGFYRSNTNMYIHLFNYRDVSSYINLGTVGRGGNVIGADMYIKFYDGGNFTFWYVNHGNMSGFGSKLVSGTSYNFVDQGAIYLAGVIGQNAYNTRLRCDLVSIPTSPLSKTYNVGSFINDNQEYNQIVVNGISSNSSTFDSITDIDYRNTLTESSDTVYSNSSWNGNYNSILNYYANGNVPVVSNINNDLNNLLTFSTNVLPVTFNNTYDVGTFINNGNEYDHINVIGTTINNSTYSSITSIDYVNNVTVSRDTVYSNGSWNDDFTSVLTYYSSGTVPDVSTINSSTSSIITFTTSLYSVNISRTYYFDFYNNDQYFTSITVNGVSNDNVVLSSVTSVYYDNTLVYDCLFITPYTRMLYYYNNMNVPDVHDLNEFCNFIVYFTPTVITTVSPDIVDELLAGVNVLLLPITSFISLAENNFVIAIILVMGLFGMVAVTVFSFIKRKNE